MINNYYVCQQSEKGIKVKRILHISKYYYPFRGGTEQIAQDCVNALQEECMQKVICFNHERGDLTDSVDGVEVIRCDCFTKISSQSLSYTYGRMLKKVINDFAPDVVIFHYPNPFVASYLLRYLSAKTKLVIYWHLDIVKQKILGKLFEGQNNRLVKRADIIIATSPNYVKGSKYLSKAKDKCRIVPNCINENRLVLTEESYILSKKIKDKCKDKIICVAVGRHTKYKGFEYLIKASKLIDERFEIFLIGEGELTDSLKKQAEGDSKIHFLGVVSDIELKAYLVAMDIFCFPSITKNEAFGVALAEAMYFAKPSVTFTIDGSGVNYVCLNGKNGIEVENMNVDMYANAMKKMADCVEIRELYGKAAKERVMEFFTYNQFCTNILNAIF